MHGRRRRAAKQWAEEILPTRCPSRRPREAADFLHLPLVISGRVVFVKGWVRMKVSWVVGV
eukprot:scaffold120976_cov48-Phaeocystis_antarctica.AAC.1